MKYFSKKELSNHVFALYFFDKVFLILDAEQTITVTSKKFKTILQKGKKYDLAHFLKNTSHI